jgi:hypothetical protein
MGRWCFFLDLSLPDFSAVASRIYELYYLDSYRLFKTLFYLPQYVVEVQLLDQYLAR